MKASAIINDEMSLDEKLAAIDAAMAHAVTNAQAQSGTTTSGLNIQDDPADMFMCVGCQ